MRFRDFRIERSPKALFNTLVAFSALLSAVFTNDYFFQSFLETIGIDSCSAFSSCSAIRAFSFLGLFFLFYFFFNFLFPLLYWFMEGGRQNNK